MSMSWLGGFTKEAAKKLKARQYERDEMLRDAEGRRVEQMKKAQDDKAKIKRKGY